MTHTYRMCGPLFGSRWQNAEAPQHRTLCLFIAEESCVTVRRRSAQNPEKLCVSVTRAVLAVLDLEGTRGGASPYLGPGARCAPIWECFEERRHKRSRLKLNAVPSITVHRLVEHAAGARLLFIYSRFARECT